MDGYCDHAIHNPIRMEQRDLIKEEFERLGQALGRVLEWMLDRSSAPNLPTIQEKAQDVLGLDLQALSVLEEEDFWQQLSAIYTLDAHWIEPLADLFFEVARLRETNGKAAIGYGRKPFYVIAGSTIKQLFIRWIGNFGWTKLPKSYFNSLTLQLLCPKIPIFS